MLSHRELELVLATLNSSSEDSSCHDSNRLADFLSALLNLQSVPDEGLDIFMQNVDWTIFQINSLSVEDFQEIRSSSNDLKLAFSFAFSGATDSAAYLYSLRDNRFKQLSKKLFEFVSNLQAQQKKLETCLRIVLDRHVPGGFHKDAITLLLIHYYTENELLVPEHALRFVESHFRLDCPFLLTYLAGLVMRHPIVFQNSYAPDAPNCWNNSKQYRVMCMLDNFASLPGGLL